MLLRVEVIPSNPTSSCQSQIIGQRSEPIFVNLKTASHHRHGTLLHVGRKDSDLTFQKGAQSLSRSHCRLRLISLNGKTLTDAEQESADNDNYLKENEPLSPKTEQEERACTHAIDGLAIVLDDLGSKFGTKAHWYYSPSESQQRKTSESQRNENILDSDAETDDEETDDEQEVAVMDSSLNNSNSSIKKVMYKKKLHKNESIILPTLSLPNDEDQEFDQNDLFAIVQCGLVSFKITRIPLNFCITRATPSDKKKIASLAPSLGARFTSFVYKSTTHLITPDSTSTAKVISAWALSIPIIIPQFVMDLSERTNSNTPLPDVKNYLAEGRFKDDDGKAAKNFLKHYTILSLMESESEMMCKCAGAEIIKLYGGDNNDTAFWQNDGFLEDIFQKCAAKESVVCLIDVTSRKIKKGKTYLETKMKDKSMNGFKLHLISQMEIAKAISSLEVLCDVNGNQLITKNTVDESIYDNSNKDVIEDKGGKDNKGCDDANISQLKKSHCDDQEIEEKVTQKSIHEKKLSPINEQTETNMQDDSIPMGIDDHDTNAEVKISRNSSIAEESNIQLKSSTSKRPKRKNVEFSQDAEWISSKLSGGVNSQSFSQNKRSRITDSQSSDGWISSQKSKKGGRNEDNHDESHIESDDYDGDGSCNTMKKKITLPVTSDGWMLVANGKPRVYKSKQKGTQSYGQSEDERKDFKRFRKNSIIAGAKMNSINPIRMVSLLPKESERRQELDLEMAEDQRRQRAGDDLFDDDGGTRKRGTSGVRSYLMPSNNSSRRKGG